MVQDPCEIAGMKPINIETLLSHNVGISSSYYRPTEGELLEDYLRVINLLTINSEHRLQKQVQEFNEKYRENDYIVKAKLTEKDDEIKSIKEQMVLMKESQKEIMALLKNPAKLLEILKEN